MSAIVSTPLQIYCSSLAFAPKKSIVRSMFEDEIAQWICLKPKVEEHWNECLQTLEGHGDCVSSVVFSHDSALIASASDDQTVCIWCADSGECLQTLKGHSDWVTSVAFSHDSTLVASASADQTVRIWRVDSGESVHNVHIGATSSRLSFDPHNSSLQTDVGIINIRMATQLQSYTTCLSGVGISPDRCWVTWNGRKLLWLPVEARPSASGLTVSGSTVVIGTTKGRILVIGVSSQKLPNPLQGARA